MFKTAFALAVLSMLLCGCWASDGQRAVIGATAGAALAHAGGYNEGVGAGFGAIGGLILK